MRRSLALFAVAAVLGAGPLGSTAYAQEEGESSGGGESAVRKPGALFDTSDQDRPQMLSFFLEVPYYGWGVGLGVGARYTIPIVKQGFIPKLNDSIEIEFGIDSWFAFNSYFNFAVPVEGRWTFQITPEFAAYGKIGIGLGGWIYTGTGGGGSFLWYPSTNLGILYKMGSIYLRAEVGAPALKVGIGIPL